MPTLPWPSWRISAKLDCVITQNIDNLHQKAGNSPEKVFELHGTMNFATLPGLL